MPPAAPQARVHPVRCRWRSTVQAICVVLVMVACASSGSGWARSRLAVPTRAAAAQAGLGGPYVPAARAPHYELVSDLAGMEPAPLGKTDRAVDLSSVVWNSAKPHWHEGLLRLLPVAPVRITSGFGHRHDPFGRGDAFHSGIDFAGAVGTPVHAAGDGVILQARRSRDYGNVVMIDHGRGIVTLYAHNSRLEVRAGEVVLAGQEIARMGSTGRSTGPHLHFEVRQYGQRIDPGRYLAGL